MAERVHIRTRNLLFIPGLHIITDSGPLIALENKDLDPITNTTFRFTEHVLHNVKRIKTLMI